MLSREIEPDLLPQAPAPTESRMLDGHGRTG